MHKMEETSEADDQRIASLGGSSSAVTLASADASASSSPPSLSSSSSSSSETCSEKELGNREYSNGDYKAAVQHWQNGLRTAKYILSKQVYSVDSPQFVEVRTLRDSLLVNLSQGCIKEGRLTEAIKYADELLSEWIQGAEEAVFSPPSSSPALLGCESKPVDKQQSPVVQTQLSGDTQDAQLVSGRAGDGESDRESSEQDEKHRRKNKRNRSQRSRRSTHCSNSRSVKTGSDAPTRNDCEPKQEGIIADSASLQNASGHLDPGLSASSSSPQLPPQLPPSAPVVSQLFPSPAILSKGLYRKAFAHFLRCEFPSALRTVNLFLTHVDSSNKAALNLKSQILTAQAKCAKKEKKMLQCVFQNIEEDPRSVNQKSRSLLNAIFGNRGGASQGSDSGMVVTLRRRCVNFVYTAKTILIAFKAICCRKRKKGE